LGNLGKFFRFRSPALLHRHIVLQRRSCVHLPRAGDAAFGVVVLLFPLGDPAGHAADGQFRELSAREVKELQKLSRHVEESTDNPRPRKFAGKGSKPIPHRNRPARGE
jgi:hypothetical protein